MTRTSRARRCVAGRRACRARPPRARPPSGRAFGGGPPQRAAGAPVAEVLRAASFVAADGGWPLPAAPTEEALAPVLVDRVDPALCDVVRFIAPLGAMPASGTLGRQVGCSCRRQPAGGVPSPSGVVDVKRRLAPRARPLGCVVSLILLCFGGIIGGSNAMSADQTGKPRVNITVSNVVPIAPRSSVSPMSVERVAISSPSSNARVSSAVGGVYGASADERTRRAPTKNPTSCGSKPHRPMRPRHLAAVVVEPSSIAFTFFATATACAYAAGRVTRRRSCGHGSGGGRATRGNDVAASSAVISPRGTGRAGAERASARNAPNRPFDHELHRATASPGP